MKIDDYGEDPNSYVWKQNLGIEEYDIRNKRK